MIYVYRLKPKGYIVLLFLGIFIIHDTLIFMSVVILNYLSMVIKSHYHQINQILLPSNMILGDYNQL
jgi:hypothetical protein